MASQLPRGGTPPGGQPPGGVRGKRMSHDQMHDALDAYDEHLQQERARVKAVRTLSPRRNTGGQGGSG